MVLYHIGCQYHPGILEMVSARACIKGKVDGGLLAPPISNGNKLYSGISWNLQKTVLV